MNHDYFKKQIKKNRIIWWSLFGLALGITLIGFLVLKLMNNNHCYDILGMGGGISSFLLLFAFISSCITCNSYKINVNVVTVYSSFRTRIILVNDKLYEKYQRVLFTKTISNAFLLGNKKVEVFISFSNEVSVKVNGKFIPKFK